MGRINVGRVILGGIIAGVIVDIIEGILNGPILGAKWNAAMALINKPPLATWQIVSYNIYGLIVGLAAIWIYAAIRPRFGPGHRTAIYAALVTWVLAYVLADWSVGILGAATWDLVVILIVVGFFEIIIATVVGAYFYKEEPA